MTFRRLNLFLKIIKADYFRADTCHTVTGSCGMKGLGVVVGKVVMGVGDVTKVVGEITVVVGRLAEVVGRLAEVVEKLCRRGRKGWRGHQRGR